MLPLRHKEEYFVKFQNIVIEIQRTVLSMENISWKIFGDGCVGHMCMVTTVARPTALRRARNLHYLKYGLGKAEYLSLTD
jgi:hypothetical protein